jgi:hypothetical protein
MKSIPVTRNLALAHTLSLVVAVLMAAASLGGLFFQNNLYASIELRRSFVSNDAVNLFIGLPILLGSLAFVQRGKLVGLLFWPGALLFVAYNFIAYTVAMPIGLMTVLYLALVILSGYTLIRLLTSIDAPAVQQRLKGRVPERLAGGMLAGFGILFLLRGIGVVVSALSGQASLSGGELGTLIADFVTTPVWVLGGVLLWRRQAFGYLTAAGLLFQASMLFVGLLVFFTLQPVLTGVPFPVNDFAAILGMGLIFFIPFGLFTRGILTK